MKTNIKVLTDFLDKYSISYTIENDIVVAGDIVLRYKNIRELPESFGNLKCDIVDLSYNNIGELPESFGNLKCNGIYLNRNNISKLPESFGNIKCISVVDLSNNNICELPESFGNLKCNNIVLSYNKISELPDNYGNLKCDYINLGNNNISKLPETFCNLKCNLINLSYNKISELPENFGNLKCNKINLSNNKISELPETFGNLKCVGINLSQNYLTTDFTTNRFKNIEITEEYIYCDEILTWIKGVKQINEYSVYLGEFDDFIVTKDNLVFAHGKSLRQALTDLLFKLSDRDASKYKSLNLNDQLSIEDAIVMYRTITGACSYGVENFMRNKTFNDTISINEINSLLKNDFGAEIFRKFFNI